MLLASAHSRQGELHGQGVRAEADPHEKRGTALLLANKTARSQWEKNKLIA